MSLTKDDVLLIRDIVHEVIFDAFEELHAPRFDAIEDRLDRLEADVASLKVSVANLEAKVANLETRLGNLETDVSSIKAVNHEILMRVGRIEHRLNESEGRIETMENDIIELYTMERIEPATDFSGSKYRSLTAREKLDVLWNELQRLSAIIDTPK